MVNRADFVKRLEKIIQYYTLSASAFADKIGVQRSSISHLLTGRNKPSLEFVLKVVKTFPEVNLYWLLNGKGVFPANTFKEKTPTRVDSEISVPVTKKESSKKEIQKIIIFYTDGSFEAFDKELS